jgi:hypothetical protein
MRPGEACKHPLQSQRPLLDRERFWAPAQSFCSLCGEILLTGDQHVAELRRSTRRRRRWRA